MIKVLHIEDDPLAAAYVESLIGDRVSLLNVPTLAAAHEVIASQPFDLLLVDLTLPDSRGPRTIASWWPYFMPVIVMSGEVVEDPKRRAEELGVQDYIAKRRMSGVELYTHVRVAVEAYKAKDGAPRGFLEPEVFELVKPFIACATLVAPLVKAAL